MQAKFERLGLNETFCGFGTHTEHVCHKLETMELYIGIRGPEMPLLKVDKIGFQQLAVSKPVGAMWVDYAPCISIKLVTCSR